MKHGMMNNRGVLGHGGYIPGDDVTIVIWGNSDGNNVNRLRVPEIAETVGAKTK